MTTKKPDVTTTQVYQIFIKATPDEIWDALTTPEFTTRYFYRSRVETTGEVGAPFRFRSSDDSSLLVDETVLESDRPRRLVVGWRSLYDPSLADEPASRVSWEIEERDDGCTLLTLIHDHLEASPRTAENVSGTGWMLVLSGLKTVLETGAGLTRDSLQ